MLSDPGKSVPAWNPEPGKNQTVKINQVRKNFHKNWENYLNQINTKNETR